MKKHVIRSQREVTILPHYENATVYHTWCNWDTIDKRTLDLGDGKNLDPFCKRCVAAIYRHGYKVYQEQVSGC